MLRDTKNSDRLRPLAAAMATSCVYAADGQPLPTPKVNEITQKVWANPDLTEPTKGIRTLAGLHRPRKRTLDFYSRIIPSLLLTGKDGRVIGTRLSLPAALNTLVKAMLRALPLIRTEPSDGLSIPFGPALHFLTSPTSLWDPQKCGECHAIQYEQWKRSVMPKTVRFLANILKSITT